MPSLEFYDWKNLAVPRLLCPLGDGAGLGLAIKGKVSSSTVRLHEVLWLSRFQSYSSRDHVPEVPCAGYTNQIPGGRNG